MSASAWRERARRAYGLHLPGHPRDEGFGRADRRQSGQEAQKRSDCVCNQSGKGPWSTSQISRLFCSRPATALHRPPSKTSVPRTAWRSRPPVAPPCSAGAAGSPARGPCPDCWSGHSPQVTRPPRLSLQPLFTCYPLPPHYLTPQSHTPTLLDSNFPPPPITLLARYLTHFHKFLFACPDRRQAP